MSDMTHADGAESASTEPAETPATPTRKRPKPGERRVQILQTLASMLEQPGAERITTAALAAKLDVSEAALYRHFASKAQMFEGLIEFIESSVFTLVNQITEREAKEKNCRTIEGAPVTIVQTPKPAPRTNAPVAANSRGDGRDGNSKVDPNAQKQRDGDARKLLEAELKREEGRLAEMQTEFNNGEPERQGGERNYQKYADRVAEMRSAINRKEEDIAAIKRELAKLQ